MHLHLQGYPKKYYKTIPEEYKKTLKGQRNKWLEKIFRFFAKSITWKPSILLRSYR